MVRRGARLTTTLLIAGGGLLLAQALGGCELLLDTGKLTEENDATAGDGAGNGGDGSGSGSSSGGSGSSSGSTDASLADAADATTDGSSSGGEDASDSGDAMMGTEVGPTDAPPCTGPLYYVSAVNGNDANPGCSPTAPTRTIAAGLAAAKAYTASPPTIEVCAGSYAESNLQLSFKASLLGGFDCASWAADGGAAGTTTITNASPATQQSTLVMFGSAVELDGFTIDGAASVATDGGTSTLTYSALEVTGIGNATISNNVLTGGSGAGGAPASAGIVVDGPSPLIAGNTIKGGSGAGGSSTVPASVGVYITTGAAPIVRGNAIDGGSGSGVVTDSTGSAGVYTSGSAGDVSIFDNTINGGTGAVSNTGAAGSGSMALWIWGGTNPVPAVRITGNVLMAGAGTVEQANTTTTAYPVRAVFLGYPGNVLFAGNTVDGGTASSGGQCPQAVDIPGSVQIPNSVVTVSGNRIHAGHCTTFSPTLNNTTHALGLRASGPITSLTIENNMIDSGQVDVHRYGEAIDLSGVVGAQVRHNTLIADTSTNYAFGLWLQGASTTLNNTIDNNIFGAIGPNAVAINSDGAGVCAPDGGTGAVSSFQNNLVFGNLAGYLHFNCAANTLAPTLDAMDSAFAAQGATVAGNLTIASSCAATDGGTMAGCVVMPCAAAGGTCLDTVFAGWDTAGTGYANLFSDAGFEGGCPATAPPVLGGIGDGWALATSDAGTPLCSVAHSSLNDVDAGVAPVTVDLYGNCRGPQPSMGAAEVPPGATCF